MNPYKNLLAAAVSLLALFALPASRAQSSPLPASGEIIKLSGDFKVSTLKTLEAKVSLVTADGKTKLRVDFPETVPFPNVQFLENGDIRNASAFIGIQADVTNLGKEPLRVGMRADNDGDPSEKPYNTAGALIGPGETETIELIFGKSWGNPAFPLDAKQITALQIYAFSPPPGSAILISNLKAFK